MVENKPGVKLRPRDYWRLWILDAVLVGAGLWFYLATNYGTGEFFGQACAMALLPFIPVMVLVGGAGSTVFALTRVWIEKRVLPRSAALGLLLGPALALVLALGLLHAGKSPARRLAYICAGHAPAAADHVRIAGYSTFLREEWLAAFNTDAKSFQALTDRARLVPADDFEFKNTLAGSSLKKSRLFQALPPPERLHCFKRVFSERDEHQRGRIYAAFDPATATAVVFREYRD